MSTYPAIGNIARLSCTFTDDTGTAVDPTTITVQYQSPQGTTTTQTPIRDSVGAYHYDLALTQPGTYRYRFIGTGIVTAQSEDRRFEVPDPSF